MPMHRVQTSELEERIAEIEKTERIVSVVGQGYQSVLVFTESKRQKPGAKETR